MYRHHDNDFTIHKYNKTGSRSELLATAGALVVVALIIAGVFVVAGFIDKYQAMQHELYAQKYGCTWSVSYNGMEVCK